MDALLTALIGCLLAEVGGASQLLVLALAARFQRPAAIIAGIAVAALANAAISTAAGAFIGPMLGSNARLLFLALAVLFLALGMLWPVKPPDPLASWAIGPFLTSAIGVFILGFGDGAQFLILGIATRTASPTLAALGGALGVMVALIPATLLREPLFRSLPWRTVRLAGGVLMLIVGFSLTVTALGLA